MDFSLLYETVYQHAVLKHVCTVRNPEMRQTFELSITYPNCLDPKVLLLNVLSNLFLEPRRRTPIARVGRFNVPNFYLLE